MTPGADAPLRLHIGCGSRVIAGWKNLDNSRSARLARIPGALPLARALRLAPPPPPGGWPRGIVWRDIRRRFPELDGSVAAIYSSHVLEHLEEPEARSALAEMHRVLIPGGLLRLVVPDARPMLEDYLRGLNVPAAAGSRSSLDAVAERLQIFPGIEERRAGRLGRLYRSLSRKHLHKWLYDAESLTARLREAGFQEVHRKGMNESALEDIASFEADFPYPVSIFLDAIA